MEGVGMRKGWVGKAECLPLASYLLTTPLMITPFCFLCYSLFTDTLLCMEHTLMPTHNTCTHTQHTHTHMHTHTQHTHTHTHTHTHQGDGRHMDARISPILCGHYSPCGSDHPTSSLSHPPLRRWHEHPHLCCQDYLPPAGFPDHAQRDHCLPADPSQPGCPR